MSRRPGASDEALIELFLDMLAAEQAEKHQKPEKTRHYHFR